MQSKHLVITVLFGALMLVDGCAHKPANQDSAVTEVKPGVKERHFKSLRQLTFEGTNAEAYFSPDGRRLIFQGRGGDVKCDQIYMMNVDGSGGVKKISDGGRTTCSYFTDNHNILYSSTQAAGSECPAEHDKSKGYVWDIFKSYDIYTADADGSNAKKLTDIDGYDAESTVCGNKVTFASARDGESVHVYVMNLDGSGLKKLTKGIGYHGGPFFSSDCKRIAYRAHIPQGKEAVDKFKKAIREAYIPQGNLEVYVMSSDGSDQRKLTDIGGASFAPSFFPDGKKIIFSSNMAKGREFNLWAINARKKDQKDGERITWEGTFNGFPMFSPDGRHFVFASNRNSKNPHELHVFLAEWQN